MGSYWLVVPNSKQPSLAVNFEVFGEVRTAWKPDEVTSITEKYGDPLAVVIGVPVDGMQHRVSWFRHQYPHSRLYLAGFISPFQLAGLDITGAIPVPLPHDFVKAVQAELDLEDELGHPLPPAPVSTITPAAPTMGNEEPGKPVGKDQIIVVFSGKGGDGKTTVAAQLGILLAKRGISTLLIDADYKGNDAEWFRGVNQPSIHSILDFRNDIPIDDRSLIESFLMEKNGLKILPCPQVEVGPTPREVLERAIQAYKPFYSVIILDMHQGYSPELLLASRYANKLIALTVPSDRRLYPFSMTLNQLLHQRVSKKNLHIVVNRAYRGEADIRKVRTGLQDVLGETFNHYHTLPFVEELSYDDDPEFVPISDMKGSELYPEAFLRMAEAVTGLMLHKSKEERRESAGSSHSTKSAKSKRKSSSRGGSGIGGLFAKFLGPASKKIAKSKKKGGKRR